MHKLAVIIPARSGSKGLPGKNLKKLYGKPLVDYSIELAKKLSCVSNIVLTSDSLDILKRGEEYGVECLQRPSYLASDNSSVIDTLIHASDWIIDNLNPSLKSILLLQPTYPIRSLNEINKSMELFVNQNYKTLVSVSEMREHPCECVKLDDTTDSWSYIVDPNGRVNRQSYPGGYYFINGNFYFSELNILKGRRTFFHASTKFYKSKDRYPVDIDSIEDFHFAEYQLLNNLSN
ncbi:MULTISPECIES: cytidylyltransferase domain-containing protein [Prochlorococcus]|uniref:acylneuraminate cytidylyltransferase family protein n=1 Tax=Prochlorococcus TaxID=1218 RepID=UPI000533778D|nr:MULTISPECIES: acylneuraminate cytidylyltransferase family protein [Prochlorococcus]KGG12104.1 N-Acetylneuraminate cytidylyltransferase [Prochlorococcus sp. MIT 0601]